MTFWPTAFFWCNCIRRRERERERVRERECVREREQCHMYTMCIPAGRTSVIGTGPVLKSKWTRDDSLSIVCQITAEGGGKIKSDTAEVKVTSGEQ